MRMLVLACFAALGSFCFLTGCIDNDLMRIQSFSPGANGSFTYAAHTNTVMTPNGDGAAERIRRDWLAETLEAQRMCNGGYVIYQRELVIPPQRPAFVGPESPVAAAVRPDADVAFGNGGDVVYSGSCLYPFYPSAPIGGAPMIE
jgi:hypothetical protein